MSFPAPGDGPAAERINTPVPTSAAISVPARCTTPATSPSSPPISTTQSLVERGGVAPFSDAMILPRSLTAIGPANSIALKCGS
jgi:hypothetical protein